jgi:DNA replication protein DnaC
MTPISKIITQLRQSNYTINDLRERRPFIRLDWEKFLDKLIENGLALQKYQGRDLNFEAETDFHIIKQLYYYAIGSSECEYDIKKGIAILGSVGRGKTMLMQAFLELFNQDPTTKNVTFFSSIQYAEELAKKPDLNANYIKRPLMLDDIGKEPSEIICYGTPKKPIGDLICARYMHGSITFFTSNFNLETLTNHYGKHVMDRLQEQCTFVYLTGESRRKKSIGDGYTPTT